MFSKQQLTDNEIIEVLMGNLNTDRRLIGKLPQGKTIASAFSELHPSKRIDDVKPLIIEWLKKKNGLVALFELDDMMIELFKTFCNENDILFEVRRYNPTDLAFSYLVMARNKSLLSTIKGFPLTTTGLYCTDEERPKQGEKASEEYTNKILFDNFEKTVIQIKIGNIDIYVTHLGLSNKAKIAQTKKIVEIIQFESVANDRQVIMAGDLNCFDVSKPGIFLLDEQLDILKEFLKWHTKHFTNTFTAYPYDIVFKMNSEEKAKYFELVKEERIDEFKLFCTEMTNKYGLEGGALDHVFASETLDLEVNQKRVYPTSDHDFIELTIKLGK